MKLLLLFASIALASGLLLTNVYTSLVDAKSWGADLPHSIATARQYYQWVSPGNFFRLFSPLNQVLGLLVLIACWRSFPEVRLLAGVALVMYVLGDVFTFAYFYPRNELLFKSTPLTDIETLQTAWREWSTMNWLRSLVLVIGLLCSCLSLHKLYSLKM